MSDQTSPAETMLAQTRSRLTALRAKRDRLMAQRRRMKGGTETASAAASPSRSQATADVRAKVTAALSARSGR